MYIYMIMYVCIIYIYVYIYEEIECVGFLLSVIATKDRMIDLIVLVDDIVYRHDKLL